MGRIDKFADWAASTDTHPRKRRAGLFSGCVLFVGMYVGTGFIAQEAGEAKTDEMWPALFLGMIALLLNLATTYFLFKTHSVPRYARTTIELGMCFSMLFYLIAVVYAAYWGAHNKSRQQRRFTAVTA